MAALITQALLQSIKNYLEQLETQGNTDASALSRELQRQQSQEIRVWLKYYMSDPQESLGGVYSSLELALASEKGDWEELDYFYYQNSPDDLYEGISIRKAGEIVITD